MDPIEADAPDCAQTVIHQAAIDRVQAQFPDAATMATLSHFFHIFGDISRIRILQALALSELCVCDLAAVLQVGRSAISHQLKLLRQANVVNVRRDGKVVYYSLKDDHVLDILVLGLTHIREESGATDPN